MSNLQALLQYQETDKNLLKIEKELAATDERKKYSQARKFLKNAQATLDGYESRAIALARELTDLEGRYKKVADDLKEFAEIDYSELEENEEEVAYLKKNAQVLSDALKGVKKSLAAVKEQMESVTQEYEKLKKQSLTMQKQFKEYKAKYEALVAEKDGEVSAIRAELSKLEKDISPDLLER
ncbi:MAG: hypothetical protein J6Z36_00355, partial [Clostridia bacterium]|nr:hypothetical protein [Clostridia bacterium]